MPPPTCLVAGARLGRLACEITCLGTYTWFCSINYFAHIISLAWNNTSIAGLSTWGFVLLVLATWIYTVSPSMCRFHHTREGVFILHAHGAVKGCLAARSSPKHYSNSILPDRIAQNACSAKIPIHKVYGDSNNIFFISGRSRLTPNVLWDVKLANLIPCVRCIGALTYKCIQAKPNWEKPYLVITGWSL